MIMDFILYVVIQLGCVIGLGVISYKAWTDFELFSYHNSDGEPLDETIMRKVIAIVCFGALLYVLEGLVRSLL